ncbi:Transcription elongation factor 1-like protein, partial [Cucurbita argyrosperma subsp. sororia]
MSINTTSSLNALYHFSIPPATRLRKRTLIPRNSISDLTHATRNGETKVNVECRIDMKNLIGEASCGICQESFSTTVTALTEPIDIYSEWIDECERVNNPEEDDGA